VFLRARRSPFPASNQPQNKGFVKRGEVSSVRNQNPAFRIEQ
jgi:hypothetical protein